MSIQGEGSRGGHVIGHYNSGRAIYGGNRDESHGGIKIAGVTGATLGASYHLNRERIGINKEAAAPNFKNFHDFKKKLRPGDILTSGTDMKNSSGFEFHETVEALPEFMQKPLKSAGKAVGLKPKSLLLSNATTLPLSGAGAKYHSGVYLGHGRVGHMTTDVGATTDSLHAFVDKNNVSVLRLKNVKQNEIREALQFSRSIVEKKTPYQSYGEYAMNAFSNYIIPINKVTKKSTRFTPLVCHTLPIRSYLKRKFTSGEHTFSGDFKNMDSMAVIAKRNVIKAGGTEAKALIGIAGRGLKWGVAAAALAAGTYYAIDKWNARKSK